MWPFKGRPKITVGQYAAVFCRESQAEKHDIKVNQYGKLVIIPDGEFANLAIDLHEARKDNHG